MFQDSSPVQTPFGLTPQAMSTGPAPLAAADMTRKRPIQALDKTTYTGHRAIQPRPSSGQYGTEGATPMQPTPGLESDSERGHRPKRGRPSKAEAERRRAAAQARGETYPPARRQRHLPMTGSTTTERRIISPRQPVYNPETRNPEPTPGGESSGTTGTSTRTGRERPAEDTTPDQMQLTSMQREARPQTETERTLPSIQSMQLVFGGDTPRTIPGTAGVRPLGPPPFSYPESNRTIPSGANTSNPGHQQGLSLEVLAGTSGNQEIARHEGGPGESGT
ncbi:hypothetical protein ANI_1_254154 [Paecilomyces variotii No. 5]|uniref:Uncharacterized protein n=1 Tax=Byssochlamys spectabilis (strain No. 5 / NBRC 109023) TaxID=1356009 RepID=V5FJC5_BYSSN|nr:hypothetical protein ANI_1_254154 [Paecilomyces variotii No. 5]